MALPHPADAAASEVPGKRRSRMTPKMLAAMRAMASDAPCTTATIGVSPKPSVDAGPVARLT